MSEVFSWSLEIRNVIRHSDQHEVSSVRVAKSAFFQCRGIEVTCVVTCLGSNAGRTRLGGQSYVELMQVATTEAGVTWLCWETSRPHLDASLACPPSCVGVTWRVHCNLHVSSRACMDFVFELLLCVSDLDILLELNM